MRKICFVCLGNICRSPMAEFVMRDLVARAGVSEEFEIESRATGDWEHGNPVHAGTQGVLRVHGVPLDARKKSRMISDADFARFDEIVAMDAKNVADLRRLAPDEAAARKVGLLRVDGRDVPDPYMTGDFDETYELVLAGCERLLRG